MRRIYFAFASAYFVYLACVDRGDAWEYAVGAAAAALAAGMAALAFLPSRGGRAYRAVPWVRYGASILRATARETGLVLGGVARALVSGRRLGGSFIRIPFAAGGGEAEDRLRRALVLWGMAVSPNDYVAAADIRKGSLLVHRLIPDAPPPGRGERLWPA